MDMEDSLGGTIVFYGMSNKNFKENNAATAPIRLLSRPHTFEWWSACARIEDKLFECICIVIIAEQVH